MSTLRDLVGGQGCAPGVSGNPIAALFSQLVDSTRKSEALPGGRLPDVRITPHDRARVAARASVHLRHVFPDAPDMFLDQQVAAFLHSIDTGTEAPVLAEDLKFQEFLRGPPQHGSGWAADFVQQQDGQQRRLPPRAAAAAGPASWHAPAQPPPAWFGDGHQPGPQPQQRSDGASTSAAAWGDEFAGEQRRDVGAQPQAGFADARFGSNGPGGWVGEFARLDLDARQGRPPPWPVRGPEGAAQAWGREFGMQEAEQHSRHPHQQSEAQSGSGWAEEFRPAAGGAADARAGPSDGASWASGFAHPSTGAAATPADVKAARGPSRDDPLNDPAAPTWVDGFNRSLGHPTVNAAEAAAAAVAADMRLAPASSNPFAAHPLPMQEGRRLLAEGRVGDASLAFEAAVQAAPDNWEAFWELSQARFELGDAAGGLLPLDRASALAPGNDEVALTLAEAAYPAGRPQAATDAAERWLDVKGFGQAAPDAPANLDDRLRAYIRREPMSPLPFRLAVCLMTCRGQLPMAADAAEQAARLAPHDASVLMQLGVSAARAQRWNVAEGAYSRLVMELEPFSPAAWEGIGRCLDAGGRPAAAMLCYLVALQIVREATGVWDRLAMSALAAGHPELAEVADTRDVRAFKQRAAAVLDADALAATTSGSQQQPFEPVLRRAWRLLRFRTRFPANAAHVDLEAM